MTEIWKDIKDYEGYYQISNLGRVKSLSRLVDNRYYNKECILKPRLHLKGYHLVALSKNGKITGHSVHRLVAETFIENPDNLPEVNHKDEDKTNNCVDNLEWCTKKYNSNYGTGTERRVAKISKPVMCIETGIIYPSVHEAGRQTNSNYRSISRCCLGLYKTTNNYHWKFV